MLVLGRTLGLASNKFCPSGIGLFIAARWLLSPYGFGMGGVHSWWLVICRFRLIAVRLVPRPIYRHGIALPDIVPRRALAT